MTRTDEVTDFDEKAPILKPGDFSPTDVLPVEALRLSAGTIELLHDAIKKKPKAKILSAETGFKRDYKNDPYAGYEETPDLYFPVTHRDKQAPLKAWSILLHSEKEALIVPLTSLDKKKKKLRLKVGGKKITLVYDKEKRLLDCQKPVEGITCLTGYYFALKTFYPDAKVHAAKK